MKSQGITELIRIHPLGNMNTQFHGISNHINSKKKFNLMVTLEKRQGITKVFKNHPLGIMFV